MCVAQATTFPPMKDKLISGNTQNDSIQQDFLAVKNSTYFKPHLCLISKTFVFFQSKKKSNFISHCHTYTPTINSKGTLLNNEFQSTFNPKGWPCNYNDFFQIILSTKCPSTEQQSHTSTAYGNLKRLISALLFVPLAHSFSTWLHTKITWRAFKNSREPLPH